ncbi:MAG: hypothetical protein ATN35_05485 [Epulopiscium sp. Nele67-Bin004]|nr:MAG: hypothetical protein ATN35_05485 [Epulopiscium sp. Nele67-Bin004]
MKDKIAYLAIGVCLCVVGAGVTGIVGQRISASTRVQDDDLVESAEDIDIASDISSDLEEVEIEEVIEVDEVEIAKQEEEDKFDDFTWAIVEILQHYGLRPAVLSEAIAEFVEYNPYVPSQGGTTADAQYALEARLGSHYQFAGLLYEIFIYLGYKTEYISGYGPTGDKHSWVGILVDDVWEYFDPVYGELGAYTNEGLEKLGYIW